LRYIHNSFGLSKNTVPIKLRLNRLNISHCAVPIRGTLDNHADLNMFVLEIHEHSETTIIPGDIPKMMVFVDNVSAVMRIVHQLRWLLTAPLRDADVVRPYQGEASASGNAKTQQLFREGITRLLVCTSAVGMDVDVNDVERVAQWRFPLRTTLDDLWQRFGRCPRDPKLSALAMVFYEPSKIVDWGFSDGHVLEGFRAYNKPASTDTQALCDH
jgi:superfamily II DNA helicase RecQ